jgi:aspartokinase
MLFHVVKVGGGCLRSAEDVVRLPEVLKEINGNIVVVSAFYGMTNLLNKIVKERSLDLFLHEFIPFHQKLVDDLDIKHSFSSYFASEIRGFRKLLSLLCELDEENTVFGEVYAEIIAKGEDFSSKIVFEYLRSVTPKRVNVAKLDSRLVVSVFPNTCINAEINQESSKVLIVSAIEKTREPFIVVVQGFVAGTHYPSGIKTALLVREGSDITAALFASALTTSREGTRLTFVKSFYRQGKDDKEILKDDVGLRRLVKHIEKTGVHVVSLKILKIEGLPTYFQIVDFNKTSVRATVAAEPIMIRSLIGILTEKGFI